MISREHTAQAELLLKEAQESPSAIPEERLVWVVAAVAHAVLAGVKQAVE